MPSAVEDGPDELGDLALTGPEVAPGGGYPGAVEEVLHHAQGRRRGGAARCRRYAGADAAAVPEGVRVSELERLRASPVKASGRVLVRELGRVSEIGGIGAGRVEVEPVPAVKLASLAR